MNQTDNETMNQNNTEVPKKSYKPILFMSIGSVAAIALFLTLNSVSVLSVLGVLLIPVLFAYPIISQKPRLLLIPCAVLCFGTVIYFAFDYAYMIPYTLGILAVVASFGVVAGFIIRAVKKSTKKRKGIIKTFTIVLVLTPCLLLGYVFAGFPIHAIHVNTVVKNYIAENYSDFNIKVGYPYYDWYDGKYVSKIYDKDDKEIYFEVWYSENWRTHKMEITDRYTYGYSWEKRLKKMIFPLLEKEYGNESENVSMGHELFRFYVTVGGVEIGQLFDKDAPVKIEGNFFVVVKDTEPLTLAAEFVKYRDFIEKNDFIFESYNFSFHRTDNDSVLWVRVQAEHINNDLVTLIEYMQNNLDEGGSYYDGDRGLRYWIR